MKLRSLLAVALLACMTTGRAHSSIVYSFSGIPLNTATVTTQPTLFASGSFSILSANQGPIPELTVDGILPASVNITVTDPGGFFRSFMTPSDFLVFDGVGPVGYAIALEWERSVNNPLLNDLIVDVVGNEMEIAFSTITFPVGYEAFTSNYSIPEPGSLVLFGGGLFGLWRMRRRG